MSKKKEKCPSCGLVNFRDAARCQWCALALRGRVQTELIDDLPRSGKPWGVLLLLFALLVVCGGVARHLKQKSDERAEMAAEVTEAADGPAKPARRTGPPRLSRRSPSDPRPPQEIDLVQKSIEMNRENAGRSADLHREMRETLERMEPRDIFGRRLLPNNDVAPLPRPGDKQSPPPDPDDPEER
jgi:hypothetical protein